MKVLVSYNGLSVTLESEKIEPETLSAVVDAVYANGKQASVGTPEFKLNGSDLTATLNRANKDQYEI